MVFHNTENKETCHVNAPEILFVARATTPKSLKEAGFVFLLHKLVFIVSLVDWYARTRLAARISLLEKESATGSMLRSHKQSVEHRDATITFSRRCNWSLWRIDTEQAGQVNQPQQYWKSLLQSLISVSKFIAERLEMMNTLDRPETFYKQNFIKRKCDASGDRFCNSFTSR